MPLPSLQAVIARDGLRADRRYGQNFLLDPNLNAKIVRAAGDLGQASVIEVGPGPGGLTRALLDTPLAELILIEADRRCAPALEEIRDADSRVRLIMADALSVDAAVLGAPPRHIIANLPYNVATPLLVRWLASASAFTGLTLMFQREVAARLAAAPASGAYGRLSVLCQWLCGVEIAFDVPARAFTPAPKVTSSLVHLTPRARPLAAAEFAMLERVTRAAFGQRRKMLRSSLKTLAVDPERLLAETAIDGRRRAETLTVPEFCALARAYRQLAAKH